MENLISKLKKFYRSGSDKLWEMLISKPTTQVFTYKDVTLLAAVNSFDETTKEKIKPQPFILFDDVVDLDHLRQAKSLLLNESLNLTWEEKAVPKLIFDCKILSFQDCLDSVKTKNSYIKGSKYNQITTNIIKIEEEKVIDIVNLKKLSYPGTDYDYVSFYKEYDCGDWFLIEGTVNGNFLYKMLCVVSQKRIYGVVYVGTENQELKNKFKPYIVAHLEVIRLGYELNLPFVDFGLHFEYKDIFGIEPTWYPGIRFKD